MGKISHTERVNIGQKRRKKRKEMRGAEINYPPHSIKWCSNNRRGDAVGAYNGGEARHSYQTERQTDRLGRGGRGWRETGGKYSFDPKCSL